MSAAANPGVLGLPQMNSFFVADTLELVRPGFIAPGVDPYWGFREFVYARYNGTIRQFGLCVLSAALVGGRMRYEATEVPNTANLGRSLAVAMVGGGAGNFGWFCITGLVPVNSSASVAADSAIGIAAAGQAGANSAGKQLLNARNILPSSTTVAKVCNAPNGTTELQIPNADGWFIGAYLSGTGMPAGVTVTAIDPSGTRATLSAATNARVAGATITATYNNATVHYNVILANRLFAQGAVT
jgi:hypothetical protein